ncbi:hypothetical protein NEOLEDRAFT_1143320 [Neolentinus lepideus HHB14362 ss-1]|uniref:PLP-dependent transferase n=1 Tax=Neolentinus lepideus HHB14362 ss-1 TaxID=1314782 RepID=A0A165MLM6_9AGAM|nr:hypothetical protein NEOLEDRAFT_1143320 [Neolentinus lepideus HHB14362 ss-1]
MPLDIEEFRKAGYKAIDRICDYYYSLHAKPVVSQVQPGYLREALPENAPEHGEDFDNVQDDYQKLIVPGLTHWQHPSFFAYFPTACTFEGILGDLYASSTSNPGFNWACSPACTELEAVVMDWTAKLLGLNPEFYNTSGRGGGVMMTSASDSALTAIVAARSRFIRLNPTIPLNNLVIYVTSQTHSLGLKAGLVLGLQVRVLDVKEEDAFALRGESLRTVIEEDREKGKRPFILVVTVGSTSSGAIDRIDEAGHVLKEYPDIWLHVDAAWAGMTLVCPEFRERAQLEAINEYATSFCTNFHKWGLVNFDASTLWVRDRTLLTDALDITPEFLRTKHGDEGTVIDYRNWHLGLGRRFRSLKVWFVLRSYGAEGFRGYIRKCISLNNQFASYIRDSPDFAFVTQPSFALTVFRLEPKMPEPLSLQSLNSLNRIFYSRLSARHDVLLTQTQLNGVFCIRLAVGAARTDDTHIKHAYDVMVEEALVAINTWRETLPAATD